MLRGSATSTNRQVELAAITDPSIDPQLAGGPALLALVDATLIGGGLDLDTARSAVLSEVGPSGLVDAAGVIGTFEMMNRIADATGMPVGRGSRSKNADLIETLRLDEIDHLD